MSTKPKQSPTHANKAFWVWAGRGGSSSQQILPVSNGQGTNMLAPLLCPLFSGFLSKSCRSMIVNTFQLSIYDMDRISTWKIQTGFQYNWSFCGWLSEHIEKLRAQTRGREVRMLLSSGTGDIWERGEKRYLGFYAQEFGLLSFSLK